MTNAIVKDTIVKWNGREVYVRSHCYDTGAHSFVHIKIDGQTFEGSASGSTEERSIQKAIFDLENKIRDYANELELNRYQKMLDHCKNKTATAKWLAKTFKL